MKTDYLSNRPDEASACLHQRFAWAQEQNVALPTMVGWLVG